MDGDGLDAIERHADSERAAFSLPAVLVQLDSDDPTEQRAAVRTIRDALAERPETCVPAVSKLRTLLERPALELECHESVAYCLAELAAESPADVAPSVDVIASFVGEHPESPATHELLRCLATVAAQRPDALAAHAATVADAVDRRPGYDRWGLCVFQSLSTVAPTALEPAVPVLTDALADDPAANGVPTLPTLGRLARTEATLSTLEFVEHATELLGHDDATLRANAAGCLADVAAGNPNALESADADLAAALADDNLETRANAAVALARVAAGTGSDIDRAQRELLALLADDHERARANACVAVGHGEVEAAADRLATLAREDPSADVRERAAWALNRIS